MMLKAENRLVLKEIYMLISGYERKIQNKRYDILLGYPNKCAKNVKFITH